jgi:hypothetical protein
MLASCDQTATDLGTRHIRFLIPRVGRAEIFVARLLGAAALMTIAQLLAGDDGDDHRRSSRAARGVEIGTIIGYGAQVTGLLVVFRFRSWG